MNLNRIFQQISLTFMLAGIAIITSCRKPAESVSKAPPMVVAPQLSVNGLGDVPGAIFRTQMESPIHWQPWTPDTLARAKDANRMIFAVVVMPQQSGFQSILDSMSRDPNMVSVLNQMYVPVLIDGDASREMGLLTADLCAEINRGLQLPLFLWLSPEANPVAWIPVSGRSIEGISETFNYSHTMVTRIWTDDPEYVSKNSALDNENRRQRISNRRNTKVASEQPQADVLRAIRQLTSLYDPLSKSFDEAGGLFPAGTLDLLAVSAVHPGLQQDLRERCMETLKSLVNDLQTSAMFDPLDGGMFSSRRSSTWSFPVFQRDAVSQARASISLLRAYQATGDEVTLRKALGLISFVEKTCLTGEGLFSLGVTKESPVMDWLWKVEDVEKALSPEDAAWWIRVTGMKGLGNLPSEVDPQREYFRGNTLAVSRETMEPPADVADETNAKFEAIRKTLLKIRDDRLGIMERDDTSHAGASFRMISAYAAAFTATGDDAYREKAVTLLKKLRAAFSDGRYLRMFAHEAPHSIGDGRAFLYALALQSILDVADITSDASWLDWSDDLATTMTELFTGGEFLKECPDRARMIDIEVTDLVMLFDDSTAGLVSAVESRLASRKRPLIDDLSKLATPLPVYSVDRPILHTDLLLATLSRHYPIQVILGDSPKPEMVRALELLPPMVHRRLAGPEDEVPEGSCLIIRAGAESRVIDNAADLKEAVLPSIKNG